MEVNATTSGVKRHNITVDPDDNTIISTTKKSRIEPDTNKKVKVLKFITELYNKIHSDIGIADLCLNISLGNQIANIVFTVFVICKQQANGINGNAEKKAKGMKTFTVMCSDVTYSVNVEKAIQYCKDTAAQVGLEFKKFDTKDADNWYGTAAPYLDFFCANGLRMNELRLGHSNMPIGKENGVATLTPVAKYGLDGSHHVLLDGSSYPPEKRSAMAQSVGPMTALLCHIRSEELEVVKGKKASEISTLVRLVADVTLVIGSRQAHRMAFPMNMFVNIYNNSKARDAAYNDMVAKLKSTETPPPKNFIETDYSLEKFTVSGRGGYCWYNEMCQKEWIMEGEMTNVEARQILFHSIFGTYKEDLTVLSQITNQGTWNTREEFKTCFQRMRTCKNIVKFTPISFKYYAKLSAANQTGLFASKYTQTCSVPVFSGRRTQHFSDDFFEQIGKRTGHTSAAKSVPQLVSALTDTLSELRDKLIAGGKKMEMGTVEWRSFVGMTLDTDGPNVEIVGTNKFFLGSGN